LDGEVILADMRAVRVHPRGEIRSVVEDEEGPIPRRQVAEAPRQIEQEIVPRALQA
jgi:hypothetical protein